MTPSSRRFLHILYWFMVFMGLLQATRPLIMGAIGVWQENPSGPPQLARTATLSERNLESPISPQNPNYKSITREKK